MARTIKPFRRKSIDKRRIVFMGMAGTFTLIPFRALVGRGLNVVGLIVPSAGAGGVGRAARWIEPGPPPATDLPLVASPVAPSAIDAASAAGLPILEVGSLADPAALAALDSLEPDLICVACFPRLLPRTWLERPALGCLNLHPSLLPAYRGPAPLFWQFRAGETQTGVTLHLMDEGPDTGDIVAQARVRFPDGIGGGEADRLTGEAGARLLLEAVSLAEVPRRPQPERGASYQPRPSPADRIVPVSWSARRAFNFVRGADEWAPFEVVVGAEKFRVSEAISCWPGERVEAAGAGPPHRREADGSLWVRFSGGAVRFR